MRLVSRFVCPNCGSLAGLAEVIRVHQFYPIQEIELYVENDDEQIRSAIEQCEFDVIFGKHVEDENGEPLVGYMCIRCGMRVADSLRDAVKWMLENGYLAPADQQGDSHGDVQS